MGPEAACTVLYDDPDLAHEIINWHARIIEEHVFPLIERLRPEIIGTSEDCCFNHGMFFSPAHFDEFCAPYYRKLGGLAAACGTDMLVVDSDGRLAELLPLLESCGVNAVHPCEVRAGNDLFDLGRRHPKFSFIGWLEKEVLNEGQEAGMESEIRNKVPPLLTRGRYFPNIDHNIQPLATFPGLCKFMTILHEVCGNPEGEFPRN
jgi:uroporphyrinogen decarboxylase